MLPQIFALLERRTPQWIKQLLPESWRMRAGYHVKVSLDQGVDELGVRVPLTFPQGESEASLHKFLAQYHVKEDGKGAGRKRYLDTALRRFIITLGLVPAKRGKLLEIGAGPYFITSLLERFRDYDLTLTNFYGADFGASGSQTLVDELGNETRLDFKNVDVEHQTLPFEDGTFDIVLLCEVLEHFVFDPLHALHEIWRVLKPEGELILTTPNVACIEHIARLLAGHNIFDPYSGYGPNGRHNREYTVAELKALLTHAGFNLETCFTADVHHNRANQYTHVSQFRSHIQQREGELGQFIFTRSTRLPSQQPLKPSWLYKDYPAAEIAQS